MSISIPQHHFTKLHKSKPCLASTAHAQNIYGSDPWSPVSRPPLNDRQRALSEALRAIGKSAAQQKYTDHMQILTPRPQLAVPFINSHVSHSTSQSSDTTGQSSNGGGAQAEKGSGSWGGNDDLGRNLERNGDSDLSNSTAWKPETGGFKCPVREKAKKNKMQHKDCMINFTSEEDARYVFF